MKRGDWMGAEAELRKARDEFPAGYRNPDGYVVTADDAKRAELLLGTAMGLQALRRSAERPDAFGPVIAHYQGLEKKYPADREVAVGLGNVYLWAGERSDNKVDRAEAYASALKQFQKVLAAKNGLADVDGPASRGKVEEGFIDAAASAPALDPAQTSIARDIAARRLASPTLEPIAAARLAWVLTRTGDADAKLQGLELLRRAAAGPLKDDERRELAGVFAGAREFKAAAELLVPLRKGVADTIKLADLYMGAREWDLARRELGS